MRIIGTASEMQLFAERVRMENHSIGFVPTMGALHAGHVSLIRRAKDENETVVVSVFVNPTQFNVGSDLEKYPRSFEKDREILEKHGVDVMFHPGVTEIYPTEIKPTCGLDGLDAYMEGPNRPGHFDGVVQVVARLFDLAIPDRAYFGEKDFQQLAIIRHMTDKLGYRVDIIGCPTVRESDGLALSSRNVRLSDEARNTAPEIFITLKYLKDALTASPPTEALARARQRLKDTEGLLLEYLELVDPETLRPIQNEAATAIQACVAVELGGVRLIDNLRVK